MTQNQCCDKCRYTIGEHVRDNLFRHDCPCHQPQQSDWKERLKEIMSDNYTQEEIGEFIADIETENAIKAFIGNELERQKGNFIAQMERAGVNQENIDAISDALNHAD